jgi:type I restriction enzyme S subunit
MSKEPIHFKQTEIGELPEGWEVKKLGEIATIKQGGRLGLTKKDYVPEGYPAFSATGQDGYVSVYEYEGEAIILSSIGAQCGKCFYATGKWTTLANTQIIFVNPEIANTLFIFYQVNRPNFWMRLGSAQPFIRPSDVKNAKVIIPPLEEQKRIAGVLRLVDRIAEETRHIVDIYERAKRFALKRLLTRGIGHTRFKQTEIGELPEGWEVVKLEDILNLIRNGTTVQQNKEGKGFPVTRIETIASGSIDPKRVGWAELTPEQFERYKMEIGDILFSHINSIEHIGKTAIYLGNPPNLVHGMNLLLLRLNREKTYPMFVFYWLNSELVRNIIKSTAKRAVNQVSINQKDVKLIPIPLPPLEEQKQIVEMLSTIDAAIENERRYLGVLEKCKRWLLDNLLTGKIRLSPEVDEILKGVLPDAF